MQGISDNKLRSRTSPGLHRLRGLRSGALSSALGGGIDNHVLGKSLSLGSALGSQIGHGGDLNKVQNLEYDFGDNSFDNHVNVNQMGGGFGDDFADFSTDALNDGFGGEKTTRKQRNKPIKGGDNIFGGSVVGTLQTLHPGRPSYKQQNCGSFMLAFGPSARFWCLYDIYANECTLIFLFGSLYNVKQNIFNCIEVF